MVEQYPHYLYSLHSEPATRNEKGDFVPGARRWQYHGRCREETNGRGAEIWTADQKAYVFASLIQMPRGTSRIAEGTTLIVTNTELETLSIDSNAIIPGMRIMGTCAKFDEGQLHCRLWL